MDRIGIVVPALVVGLLVGGAACSSHDVGPLRLGILSIIAEGGALNGSSGASGAAGTSSSDGGSGSSSGGASGASGMGGPAGGRAGATGSAGSAGVSGGGKGGQAGSGAAGAASCTYDGMQHPAGTTFRASDGCNTCSCNAGTVACTKRACVADAGDDAGGACTREMPAKICVRGAMTTSSGEQIKVGDKVTVEVQPRGCFSSSCTVVHTASCTVTNPMQHVVEAHFCVSSTVSAGVGCTADCSGGGVASCSPNAGLSQGQHTFTLGALSVTFSVPGVLPIGGECIGSPF
jgi:hypothetical protein